MSLMQIRRNFQLTLPIKIRRELNLKEGDLVEVELLDHQAIIIKPKRVTDRGRDFSSQEISRWLKEDKLDKVALAKARKLAGDGKIKNAQS